MITKLITSLIPDHTARAIAWTLIHSLWIGLLFAAIAGIIVTFSKKASARLRYHLLCATLLAFVGIMVFTLLREIRINNINATTAAAATAFSPVRAMVRHSGFVRQAILLLNNQSSSIFFIWSLFFVFKSIRLTGGMLYIKKLRTRHTSAVPAQWQQKFKNYCATINISRPVKLLQSELISGPVAIGWLKPVILVPVGMVCQLSPEQVESILLHELAHVSRQDYIINILQGMVESVFFFNPALLWLSSLIRQEREACCDDVVLTHINRKSDYLEALLALGTHTGKATLAMNLSSGSYQLKNRLKRMIYLENQKLSLREVLSLFIGVVFILTFTILPKAEATILHHKASVAIFRSDNLRADNFQNQPLLAAIKKPAMPHSNTLTAKEINGMKMYGNEASNYQDMLTQIDQAMQGPDINSSKHNPDVKDTVAAATSHYQQVVTDSIPANGSSTAKNLNHQNDISAIEKGKGEIE